MAQHIDVPGIGPVEFPDEMSDDQIAHAIQTQIIPQHQVEQVSPGGSPDNTLALTGAAAAVPAIARGTQAVGQGIQTAGQIAQPAVSGAWSAGKELAGSYLKNPGTLAADVIASHLGLPPPVASVKAKPLYNGIQQSYLNAKDYVNKTGQFAPPTVNPNAPTTGAPVPNELGAAQSLSNQMTPEEFVTHMQTGGEIPPRLAGGTSAPIPKAPPLPAVGTADNFLARMGSLYEQYGKPAATAIAESPVGRVAGAVLNNPVTRFAGSKAGVGLQLALHSGDLNSGEAEQVRLMHEKQDIERQQLANKHATEMSKYVQAKQKVLQ